MRIGIIGANVCRRGRGAGGCSSILAEGVRCESGVKESALGERHGEPRPRHRRQARGYFKGRSWGGTEVLRLAGGGG